MSLASLRARAREFFLLEQAEAAVRSWSPRQREIVETHVRAAKRRLRMVSVFAGPETAVPAATVLREAIGLLVRALVVARAPGAGDATLAEIETASAFEDLCRNDATAPADWEKALSFLRATDPLLVDAMPPDEADLLTATLQRCARWLRSRVEMRTETNLRALRWGRAAALVVAACYVVYHLVAALLAPPNIALHKPVTLSTRYPGGPDGEALVDGVTSADRAPGMADANIVHTERGRSWALIDLGGVHALRQIRIYNRADGYFDEGLPYELELSNDGRTFESISERSTHFGSSRFFDRPWVVDVRGQRARYVRVLSNHYLALSEVQVFGR